MLVHQDSTDNLDREFPDIFLDNSASIPLVSYPDSGTDTEPASDPEHFPQEVVSSASRCRSVAAFCKGIKHKYKRWDKDHHLRLQQQKKPVSPLTVPVREVEPAPSGSELPPPEAASSMPLAEAAATLERLLHMLPPIPTSIRVAETCLERLQGEEPVFSTGEAIEASIDCVIQESRLYAELKDAQEFIDKASIVPIAKFDIVQDSDVDAPNHLLCLNTVLQFVTIHLMCPLLPGVILFCLKLSNWFLAQLSARGSGA